MRKVQVNLRDDQRDALRAISLRTGARQADLIRKGVDLLVSASTGSATDWRVATRAAAGLWKGREGLDDDLAAGRNALKRRMSSIYGSQ